MRMQKGFGENAKTISVTAPPSAPSPMDISSVSSIGEAIMASVYNQPPSVVVPLTKEKYSEVVKNKRREFVHLHFSKELESLFKSLSEDAEKMKVCHREVTFEIPEMFSVEKAESVISAYFIDLGYKPLVENRKEDCITLTIT